MVPLVPFYGIGPVSGRQSETWGGGASRIHHESLHALPLPHFQLIVVPIDEWREHDGHRKWNRNRLRYSLHDEQPHGVDVVVSTLEHSGYASVIVSNKSDVINTLETEIVNLTINNER